MNLKEIKIEPEMFREWHKMSVPRPVLLIGRRIPEEKVNDVVEAEWLNYVIQIPMIAGYWDPRRYGACAFLGIGSEWHEDKLYDVPIEQYINVEDLYPDRSCQRRKMTLVDAIMQAESLGDVEKRFAWVDNENDMLRIACRAMQYEWAKRDYKEGLLKGILNARYRLVSEEDYGKYSAIKS